MKTLSGLSPMLFLSLALAGCAGEEAAPSGEANPETKAASSPLEAALHDVDLGVNLAAAKTTLETALQQNAVSGEARDDVEIALAVAYKGLGDDERALSTLEATIARGGRSEWSRQQDATRLLVRWLTGVDRPPVRSASDPSALLVAPVAHALARTLPRSSKDRVDINLAIFGGDETSELLGTLHLDSALRQQAEEQCPLCDRDLSIRTNRSRYGDWTSLMVEAEHFAETLAVFYYDLETGKIPPRYDGYLPMPSAAIAQRLADGKGFYAVKQRPGAPPIVLFAAPRRAQLAAVEGAFAVRTDLPEEPVSVALPQGLLSREIKAAIRGQFGAFKACYEALPEPRPSGKLELAFSIDGAGSVQRASAGPATTLDAPAFTRCILQEAEKVKFAALGGRGETTVRYPITFRPD